MICDTCGKATSFDDTVAHAPGCEGDLELAADFFNVGRRPIRPRAWCSWPCWLAQHTVYTESASDGAVAGNVLPTGVSSLNSVGSADPAIFSETPQQTGATQ